MDRQEELIVHVLQALKLADELRRVDVAIDLDRARVRLSEAPFDGYPPAPTGSLLFDATGILAN